jgi:hypothetical protein
MPEDRGVGDTVTRTIGRIGGDAFKKWFHALTGHPCGCDTRHERLNARYPFPAQLNRGMICNS